MEAPYHMYRYGMTYGYEGGEIPRSRHASWVGATGMLLRSLIDALRRHVFTSTKLRTDDTLRLGTPSPKRHMAVPAT